MHVVYDFQIFALQNVGGISRYFVELAARLPLVCPGIVTTILAPLHINKHVQQATVKVIGRKMAGFPGKHRVLFPLNRTASAIMGKKLAADIVHETYYIQRSNIHGSARVLTVFDMIHERFPQEFSGPDKEVTRQKAAAVMRADHIITISQSTCRDLMAYLNVPQRKISVIPLASSLEGLAMPTNGTETGRPYLLYVGLRQGVKNFARLLKAYQQSQMLRRHFDLICAGGGAFSTAESRSIHAADLHRQIRQVEVDDQLLRNLYCNATVFVYPSLYEGFGLPLLEAMRCGCPVACSRTSSMPEIAGDAAHYFNPEDEEEMRVVLEKIGQSEAEREMLRQRGYERERLFSWNLCVEKTAEVYSSLL